MKKIKLFLYINFIIIVLSGIFYYYFYNIFLEKENNRNALSKSNIILNYNNYYDDFKIKHIESINKKNIDQDVFVRYKVEDVLSEEDYIKIKDFTLIYEKELNKNFNPIMGLKSGYCEIVINPRNKNYNIKNCIPNHIFKRSVELSILSFNEKFYMYDDVKNIKTNINIYFKYGE